MRPPKRPAGVFEVLDVVLVFGTQQYEAFTGIVLEVDGDMLRVGPKGSVPGSDVGLVVPKSDVRRIGGKGGKRSVKWGKKNAPGGGAA